MGTVILINNTLVVLSDRGEIALIKATAEVAFMKWPVFKYWEARITGHHLAMQMAECIVVQALVVCVYQWGNHFNPINFSMQILPCWFGD